MKKILLCMVMSVYFFGYGQNVGKDVILLDKSGNVSYVTILNDTTIDGWHYYKVSGNKYGREDSVFFVEPVYDTIPKDTVYFYLGKVEKDKPKKDNSKYYYQMYLKLKNKGVPDSINHWYYLLNKK